MSQFFEAFANMFRIPDLRKRILFTLAILAVYRLGAFLPTPGINTDVLQQLFNQNQGSFLGIIDLFSGGNFRKLTIFALGIMPYITSSIILQLMTVVWPYLERLQKEGELGRRKITQYTRYLTIILSVVQSLTIASTLQHQGGPGNQPLVYNPGWSFTLMTVLTLTTGSCFIMWLGEQISERGVGNGMSLIIFTGIVVGLPRGVLDLWQKAAHQQWGPLTGLAIIMLLGVMLAVIAFIVFVEGGQRRIPVQYAKRVVGRKVMGGQMTYLPLRVNSGGVIPPIFASSLLTFSADDQSRFWEKSGRNQQSCDGARLGRTAVHADIRLADYLVRVFLRRHRLQPDRTGGQHAQVRRLRSRHTARTQYVRPHQQDSRAADVRRRRLPCGGLLAAGMVDFRNSLAAPVRRDRHLV